ncbi:helix-turn-helix domain-containing protein [Alteromonas sp. 5E99-2]|uniref:helix-turn-helix domain-containing protein n=1 Tax=Alteromonas sp. 5E99-2 TaxID=2817683 RepID=UPI001A99636A|nr:helix-turn-helix domain-containing protein [Alteromonas sp. 5E99-2]MBO1256879.1 helix-turn-helix domain-containing protein [Alteromonas sp. 5E99-2]
MASTNPLVVILTYNNLCMFEYAIALEIFALPRPEIDTWYDYKIVSVNQAKITAGLGNVMVNASTDLNTLLEASLIIVPGWDGEASADLKRVLRQANQQGVRIATICSGVFLPAQCGLLDGKNVTTHWRYTDKLQAEFPQTKVNPDVLYVDEGTILTSAGSAAGIDLCLHIVRNDFGSETANSVARRLVLPVHREGGQAQFIPKPTLKTNDRFSPFLDEIRTKLNENWPIERMSDVIGMSPRTLLRRFKNSTGETPLAWLTLERVSLARELLETTTNNVDQIAIAAGFRSPELLRLHFKRHFKVSPLTYRAQFQR